VRVCWSADSSDFIGMKEERAVVNTVKSGEVPGWQARRPGKGAPCPPGASTFYQFLSPNHSLSVSASHIGHIGRGSDRNR